MGTRRRALESWERPDTLRSHAGLWLDKFIKDQTSVDTTSKRDLVVEVSSIPEPEVYQHWFKLWRADLTSCGAQLRMAATIGRMAVGLGNETVLETSVTLHRTFGVPYIPGSALKGTAARFAREYLGEKWRPRNSDDKKPNAYGILFGDTDSAGYVTFFDALPLPGLWHLRPDVVTVHHPAYYRNESEPPADWDSPIPVPFLSATGKFLVALAGPPRWVAAGFDILRHALFQLGIGAKTSSGYGRMILEEFEQSGQRGRNAERRGYR
ncbi:MAG TPA: type III-B CRISPR module RAMP protein Cmr6 [Firmicutes bacterium]|nr:type III-B CRISPR module RAMP protein Cmr6 [Bacillota bacterium]